MAIIIALCLIPVWQNYKAEDAVAPASTNNSDGFESNAGKLLNSSSQGRQTSPNQESQSYGKLDCRDAIIWTGAKFNVGKVVTIFGPFKSSASRPDVNGSPLWINIGNDYPNPNRLVAVIWGNNSMNFNAKMLDIRSWRRQPSEESPMPTICVRGKITEHQGVPQVELEDINQLTIYEDDEYDIWPKDSRSPYRYSFGRRGISCEIEVDQEPTPPRLDSNGHFGCPCYTDMGCMMVNPHIPEGSEEIDQSVVAMAPKGATCRNPVLWTEAKENVGRTLVVRGPVINAKLRNSAKGSSLLLDIGQDYPDTERLTLIFQLSGGDEVKPEQVTEFTGKHICTIGKISEYNGSMQISVLPGTAYMLSE